MSMICKYGGVCDGCMSCMAPDDDEDYFDEFEDEDEEEDDDDEGYID